MPAWMDRCVKSYKEKNPDAEDSDAWAICATAYRTKFGHWPAREDIVAAALELQVTEALQLTFSDNDKRRLLQRAVRDLYQDYSDDGIAPISPWVVSVYPTHFVVEVGNRLFAIDYEITDHHNVELGEPIEVEAGYIGVEAAQVRYVLAEGWLPQGMTQTDLDDGDFAWLSFAYQKASPDDRKKMNKRQHRKLPYKVRGKVNLKGWLAAWKAAKWTTYLRPSFRGGPSREQVLAKLKRDKPSKVRLKKDGTYTVKEELEMDVLLEGVLADFVQEEAKPGEENFALVFSANVIPGPNTEQGVWSKNHRLYPSSAVDKIYESSQEFLTEGGVATVHTSHAASMGTKLPIGRVLGYYRDDAAVRFRGGIVGTTEGSDAVKLFDAGVLKFVSLRTHEWKSEMKKVEGLGMCEVMEDAVIHGIDFTQFAGLPDTEVQREEEVDMDFKSLTLAELNEKRPDIVAEILEGHKPKPEVQEVVPADVALELDILKASNTGLGSLVAQRLMEKVEDAEGLTEEAVEEARTWAIGELYKNQTPAAATNMRGSSVPPKTEGDSQPKGDLTEEQELILDAIA